MIRYFRAVFSDPDSDGRCRQRHARSEVVPKLSDLLIADHCNSPLEGELQAFSKRFQPVILIVANRENISRYTATNTTIIGENILIFFSSVTEKA
jgi:hypothetical protein